jgi:hypothetical protein
MRELNRWKYNFLFVGDEIKHYEFWKANAIEMAFISIGLEERKSTVFTILRMYYTNAASSRFNFLFG